MMLSKRLNFKKLKNEENVFESVQYVGPVTVSSRWVITKNKQSAKDIWRLSGSDMVSKRQF